MVPPALASKFNRASPSIFSSTSPPYLAKPIPFSFCRSRIQLERRSSNPASRPNAPRKASSSRFLPVSAKATTNFSSLIKSRERQFPPASFRLQLHFLHKFSSISRSVVTARGDTHVPEGAPYVPFPRVRSRV